jgi:hypothetical protein
MRQQSRFFISFHFVNPHAKRPAAAVSEVDDVADDLPMMNAAVTDFTIGIQLQLREGTIKK